MAREKEKHLFTSHIMYVPCYEYVCPCHARRELTGASWQDSLAQKWNM